ncbi:MAG: VTT domain-containing protein [Bradymonadaceae bacterium]|nr:VTT domain-containing protein [Lujinxingiaceae bacterium]
MNERPLAVVPYAASAQCGLFVRNAVESATDIVDDRLFRKLAWQSAGITLLLFAVVVIIALLFREPVTQIATVVIEHLGILGIFLGVLAADGLTFPIPPTTYLFVAVAAEAPMAPVLIAAGLASVLGGSLAYFVGPYLQKVPFLDRRIEAFRPRGEALFERFGGWTIAIAALTPLPFSIMCWFAGIYNMPYRRFFAITLIRAPRLVIYYGLFILGWTATL